MKTNFEPKETLLVKRTVIQDNIAYAGYFFETHIETEEFLKKHRDYRVLQMNKLGLWVVHKNDIGQKIPEHASKKVPLEMDAVNRMVNRLLEN